MTTTDNCIFCQIVSGTAPAHVVWEDEKHIAFLSIFPNTEGVTVVTTKEHHNSYVFDVPLAVSLPLFESARTVARRIDAAYEDVGRTALVFEGFGVDHIHAKLFPLHGTMDSSWKKHSSPIDTYFPRYQGYISSNDAVRADDESLSQTARHIRGE